MPAYRFLLFDGDAKFGSNGVVRERDVEINLSALPFAVRTKAGLRSVGSGVVDETCSITSRSQTSGI